jgi:3-hydroxyacyl-[acyl-carrier-protein] dehydratase
VLMLEALTQSAAWLVRLHDDWAYSLVVLQSARNLKYASFLRPGNTLRCEVEVMKLNETEAKFKAVGYVGETLAVSARIELSRTRLSDTKGARGERIDARLIADLKNEFELVGGPDVLESQS